MNRNQAKEFYPIMQAFAEGKAIECRTRVWELNKGWKETEELKFQDTYEYRIKPESTYRPFKNAKECWQEMLNHQPFGWVKTDSGYEPIWHVNEGDDFNETFKYSTFADGTPFGIKEGE